MKREFLQNFKVGDQPLTKEIIDAIMAENGRDIEEAKKPFADYDTIKQQLTTAQETIKGFESQDIEGVRKSAQEWEKKYNDAIADHQKKMDDIAFDGVLTEVIQAAKGRNVKAIKALLDLDTLRASKNQAADAKAAVEALQKDTGYLFGDDQDGAHPAFSTGTGTGGNSAAYDSDAALRAAMGLPAKQN